MLKVKHFETEGYILGCRLNEVDPVTKRYEILLGVDTIESLKLRSMGMQPVHTNENILDDTALTVFKFVRPARKHKMSHKLMLLDSQGFSLKPAQLGPGMIVKVYGHTVPKPDWRNYSRAIAEGTFESIQTYNTLKEASHG